MKTELDLLTEALQRLDGHYRHRDQQLDQHLNALASQVEHLAKQVNNSNAYIASVTAHLTRSHEQQLSVLTVQLEHLARQVNSLSAQLTRLKGA